MHKIFELGLASVIVLSSLSQSAWASYDPSRTDVVATAKMVITSAKNLFQNVRDVQLDLTKKSGDPSPSGIRIRYTLAADPLNFSEVTIAEKNLTLKEVTQDACGSTVYVGNLSDSSADRPDLPGQARYRVTLVDHSTRFCKDAPSENREERTGWEASVQSSFTGYEAMDSEMKLKGSPEVIYSIQLTELESVEEGS